MASELNIKQLLDLYFKDGLSSEEKMRMFETIRNNPSLNETIQSILDGIEPAKVEQFLSEESLMCDISALPESDETQIELFLSGLMSQEEEEKFKESLRSNDDLQTNILAQAFLIKAIQKIQREDVEILKSAKEIGVSDLTAILDDLRNEEDDEKIERYLNGSMSKDENEVFEARINSDAKLKDRVSSIVILNKGIREQLKDTSLTLKDAARLSREDVESVIKDERQKENVIKVNFWSKFRRIAAVLIPVFIVAGVGWDYYNASSMMGIAGENINFAMSMSQPTRSGASAEQDSVIAELNTLFNIVRDKEGISDSVVSRLRGYYDMVTDDKVDFEDSYVDQISLAMATAYIYNDQKDEAKAILRQTIDNEEVSAEAKAKAKALLPKVKKTLFF